MGNAATSFVSGSNNLLEISSSNFHLDASGNVDMTGTVTATAGAIGGFTIANSHITGSGGIFVTSDKSTISGGPSSGTDDTRRVELLPANLRIRSGAGDPLSVNGFDASHIIFDAISTGSFNYSDGETTNYVRRVATRMENAQFGIYDTSDSFTSGNIFIGKGVRPNASIRNQLADTNADSMIYPDTTNGGFIVMESLEVKARPSNTNANITRNYTNARFSVVGQSYLGNTELQGDVVLGYNSGDTIIFSGSVDSDINMGATRKLYFDGGSDTYITEAAADRIEIVAGGTPMLSIKENGTSSRTLIYRDLYIDGAANAAGSGDGLDADYLRLHNNGSNSYIDFGSGNLYIRDDGINAITVADSTRAVTIATDLTIGHDLFVNDFARIDALRVGTTSTDPGDGQLYVEGDITVADDLFVGDCAHIDALHVGTGTDTDPGDGNLSVDGNILINGITDAGGVPKFLVRRTSDTSALVSNTWTTIVFNSEDFDTGSDYNVTNGIFSAPAAGYYHFSWQIRFNNMSTATDYIWTKLLTTDEDILAGLVRIDDFANATIAYWQTGGSATVHLDAGDTVRVQALQINSSTSVTVDGSTSNYQSWFTGHMLI